MCLVSLQSNICMVVQGLGVRVVWKLLFVLVPEALGLPMLCHCSRRATAKGALAGTRAAQRMLRKSGISRIQFIHSSNQIPCSSNVVCVVFSCLAILLIEGCLNSIL